MSDKKEKKSSKSTEVLASELVIDVFRNSVPKTKLHIPVVSNDFLVFKQLIEDTARYHSLAGVTNNAVAELHKLGRFTPSTVLSQEIKKMQSTMDDFNLRFSLPELSAVTQLAEQYKGSAMSEFVAQFSENNASLKEAMGVMRSPWLDVNNVRDSFKGFAGLQDVGSILRNLPTYNDNLSSMLRTVLGDWRDQIIWEEPVFNDLVARSEFYVGLGFDRTLADFPAEAFDEGTGIAGLRIRPSLIVEYGVPIRPIESEVEEIALARTNQAHEWLFRLESQLRQFIDVQMTFVFGSKWMKQRLPNGLYDEWQNKMEVAEKNGRPVFPLLSYADFRDYEKIICKRDNWSQVFRYFFMRPENVRESFQRLHPIRLDTMHARPITQEDEILLYAETKRFMNQIYSKSRAS